MFFRKRRTTQPKTPTECSGTVRSLFLPILTFQGSGASIGAGPKPSRRSPTTSVLLSECDSFQFYLQVSLRVWETPILRIIMSRGQWTVRLPPERLVESFENIVFPWSVHSGTFLGSFSSHVERFVNNSWFVKKTLIADPPVKSHSARTLIWSPVFANIQFRRSLHAQSKTLAESSAMCNQIDLHLLISERPYHEGAGPKPIGSPNSFGIMSSNCWIVNQVPTQTTLRMLRRNDIFRWCHI